MGFLFLAFLNILYKWFIFEKLIILGEWRLTFKKKLWVDFILRRLPNLDKTKWLQQIPQTLSKQTLLFVEGMPKPHMVKNSVHNFGWEGSIVGCLSGPFSLFTVCVYTLPVQFTQTHTFSLPNTNIHTLIHTNTATSFTTIQQTESVTVNKPPLENSLEGTTTTESKPDHSRTPNMFWF